MTKAATAFSKFQHSQAAAEVCARDALKKMGAGQADFAIIYTTAHHHKHLNSIAQTVQKISGAKHIVGGTEYGVITEACEIEDEPSIALMLVQSDTIEAASVQAPHLQESNYRAGSCAGEILSHHQSPAAILLSPDHYSFQSALFFEGLESQIGHVPCIGGTASENGKMQKTFQICDDKIGFDTATLLALSGNIRLEHAVTQSCYPLGEPVRITRSEGHSIYEIEGRPAYDLYLECASQMESIQTNQSDPDIFMGLPLHSFQTDFSKANYMIHNIAKVNTQNGMISCSAPVAEGEYVTFTVRDAVKARHDLESTLCDLREKMAAPPLFGFYFNCCTRGQGLYQNKNQDIQLIRDFFPNVPILGNFAYGEIAPVDFANHLHHYSGALCFFTEL